MRAIRAFLTRGPATPSTTVSAAPAPGRAAGWLADLLYFLFGRPALLIPLALGVVAFRLARSRPDGEIGSRANAAVRALAFGVLQASSCALAALHWSPGVLRQSAGGVVGMGVGSTAAAGLNLLGATLLF